MRGWCWGGAGKRAGGVDSTDSRSQASSSPDDPPPPPNDPPAPADTSDPPSTSRPLRDTTPALYLRGGAGLEPAADVPADAPADSAAPPSPSPPYPPRYRACQASSCPTAPPPTTRSKSKHPRSYSHRHYHRDPSTQRSPPNRALADDSGHELSSEGKSERRERRRKERGKSAPPYWRVWIWRCGRGMRVVCTTGAAGTVPDVSGVFGEWEAAPLRILSSMA